MQCFSTDELRAFAFGRLPDVDSEHVAAHLADCASCEETLAAFDDTADSLIENFRRAALADDSAGGGSPAVLNKAISEIIQPGRSIRQAPDDSVCDVVRDYELLEQLGSGGMGTVYRAVHTRLKRVVALKLLPGRRLRNQSAVERFEREMEAIGRLDHPAIVRATDAGEVDGTYFLAMDYVDGIDLSQLIKLSGPLPTASACEIIRQISIGLQYAHEQGLIHRDVKPGNIMLEAPGTTGADDGQFASVEPRVKLLDLGLALFGAASEAVDELTTVGQLMGTLDYMAPEQADNSHDVSFAADVYSLGATLFKLLTGKAPYETDDCRTPLRKMKALATVDVPSIAERDPGIPREIVEIVDRMLVRDVSQRVSSAGEVAELLKPHCEGHNLPEVAANGMKLKRDDDSKLAQSSNDLRVPFNDAKSRNESRSASVSPAQHGNGQPPFVARNWKRWTLFSFPFFVLLGTIIWLETDRGTLKIECFDDDVPVTIQQGEIVVEELSLSAGENTVTLRSGRYEISLPKQKQDQLHIQHGEFSLTRNSVHVVRISAVDSLSETSDAAPRQSIGDKVALSEMPSPQREYVNEGAVTSITESIEEARRQPLNPTTYTLGPGDLLGIHIDGITGEVATPQDASLRDPLLLPASGLPVLVIDDGFVHLPLGASIQAEGRTLAELRDDIRNWYVSREIVAQGRQHVSVSVLERRTPKVEELTRIYRSQPGDVLGVYIPELLRDQSQTTARLYYPKGKYQPAAMGSAVTVEANGTIDLQFVGSIQVEGMSLSEMRTAVIKACQVEKAVLTPDGWGPFSITVMQPVPEPIPSPPQIISSSPPVEVEEQPTSKKRMEETSLQPRFESKTFQQWRQVTEIERSPEELEKAISALTALGRGDRDLDAADAIFSITRRYPCNLAVRDAESRLITTAVRHLRKLSPDEVIRSAEKELRRAESGNHELIAGWLCSKSLGLADVGSVDFSDWGMGAPEPLRKAFYDSATFGKVMVASREKIWNVANELRGPDGTPVGGAGPQIATDFYIHNWRKKEPDAATLDCLEALLNDDDLAIRGKAAMVLARYRPDEKLISPLLSSLTQNPRVSNTDGASYAIKVSLRRGLPALQGLALLGPKARNAVPTLLRINGQGNNSKVSYRIENFPIEGRDELLSAKTTPEIFVIDLLGRIQHDTPDVRQVLNNSFKQLYGEEPIEDGDFTVSAGWRFNLHEMIVDEELPGTVPEFSHQPEMFDVSAAVLQLNAALFAWEQITGEPPRFANNYIGRYAASNSPPEMRIVEPKLVALKGRPLTEWGESKAMIGESFEDLEERFWILYQAGPDLTSARNAIAIHMLKQNEYTVSERVIVNNLLTSTDYAKEVDHALARRFNSGSQAEKEAIIAEVIARTEIVHAFDHSSAFGSGSRKLPTLLQKSALSYWPETFQSVCELLKDFDELPPTMQKHLMLMMDAALVLTNSPDNSYQMKALKVEVDYDVIHSVLLSLVNDRESPWCLDAAIGLSRNCDGNEEICDAIRPVLLEAVTTAKPKTNWINAAVALPRVYKELPLNLASQFVDIIDDDSRNRLHKFQIIVPGNAAQPGFTSIEPLHLSRRTLLLHVLATVPFADQASRNKIATELFTKCPDSLYSQPPRRGGEMQTTTICKMCDHFRIVDTMETSRYEIVTGLTVFDAAMTSMLGKSWRSTVAQLIDQHEKESRISN